MFKRQPRGLCVTEKLKLHRDFSHYNYLSLDSAVVNGLDDAANFRTVRVSSAVLLHALPNSDKTNYYKRSLWSLAAPHRLDPVQRLASPYLLDTDWTQTRLLQNQAELLTEPELKIKLKHWIFIYYINVLIYFKTLATGVSHRMLWLCGVLCPAAVLALASVVSHIVVLFPFRFTSCFPYSCIQDVPTKQYASIWLLFT